MKRETDNQSQYLAHGPVLQGLVLSKPKVSAKDGAAEITRLEDFSTKILDFKVVQGIGAFRW